MKTLFLILIGFVVINVSAQSKPNHPFFEMSVEKKRALVEKALEIKAGDSYQSVTNKLGEPTYDQPLMRKENRKIIGRSLSYYAAIWEKGLVSEFHDELVEVFCDEQDKVQSIRLRVTLK